MNITIKNNFESPSSLHTHLITITNPTILTEFYNLFHIMFFSSLQSIFRGVMIHRPLLRNAAIWTILLTLTVAVASFAPEFAFVSTISPSSSRSCYASSGFIRIPLDFPRESVCLPSHMVKRSKLDFFVPTVFAGLIVAGSAFVVRSMCLWESGTGRRA
ncbi:hypothetical protein Ddye_024904 [Dipteronia dyeriana]|uniref:Uncharacterized protein n=1 Tax=Dipteronia dyeriana TaxID=168575 RepID=A0AAD9WU21_9ROSI|nr:hypothetical protein Ddye_024904 [Dipteronia dyeriana]